MPGILQGGQPMRMLIRGVGPQLADFGVVDILADPVLRLFDGAAAPVDENDNWNSHPHAAEIRAVLDQVGAFALEEGSQDAALLVELAPGRYTVQLNPADGAEGVALLELYEVR
ncbi:MAG: hypothetical protein J6386_17220 [Candidatus Synoicihabitans palmerolidicus]|nr:hypothetical protein [Candidatus Synoicihabitans palmerolidicus]